MKLVRSIFSDALPKQGCVLTIGNFDAVHLGHQQILESLRLQGDKRGLPVVVMTFDPHPEEYFRGANSSPRLTECSTRYFALKDQGVDVMLLLKFNKALADTSAEEFIQRYLIDSLKVRYVLIGDDFRFGQGRRGDYALLRQFSNPGNFEVDNSKTIVSDAERISSTRIRKLLAIGEFRAAEKLLGRRYNLVGRVSRGQQLGRQWGFPTMNLVITHKPAITGIFAVEVTGLGDCRLPGVASLGRRPTLGDNLETLLEVYLFDFDRSVYGERICVEFIGKIRGEEKFDSMETLRHQIGIDVENARSMLGMQ